MDAEELTGRVLSRRSALKRGAATAFLLTQATLFEQLALAPLRPAAAAAAFSDIQFDLGAFVHPAQVFNDGAGNVTAQFGVTFMLLQPAKLTRTPTKAEQATLSNALRIIEAEYPVSPAGMLIGSVSYGLPYFNRLPRSLFTANVPHLLSNTSRFVLEEAAPMATDVVGGFVGGPNAPIPGVTKDRFNVNVVIENNDMLFQFRSDSMTNLSDVSLWLQGSNTLNGASVASPAWGGLIAFQAPRIQFVQPGLPRKMADQAGFEFASRINPDSSMTMGFVDQQLNASGPAAICTFVGNSSAKLTDAQPGSYFDNGSIAHFSHDIEDLYQFYALENQDPRHPDGESFQERCQYMYRSNQLGTTHGLPAEGNTDQFTNGGGPAFINNVFQGTNDAMLAAQDSAGQFAPGNQSQSATFTGLPRIGHNAGLQRVSRAADGTPMHIRNDGPGLDGMDVPAFQPFPGQATVPAGSNQFKLQFLMFVPTADLFARMRTAVAAQDLQVQFGVDPDDNGLERFITATRRQNFLVPPRRHRAFPLLELT
ncbi:MAG TPA: hypothetical protein VFU73_05955 [Actinocrinis sp.]|nr:hypothetical protein [Actinocrinis sp.]